MSVEPVTKTEWVYSQLRERITSGELRPGERLRLQALATELSTSPIPVREALRMLQSDGLVDIESHRGATVADPSWERVYEAVMIRMHLEVLAAREAAAHHDEASLARVERQLERMDAAAARGQPARFSEANRAFHTAVYEPAPFPLLRSEIDSLWNQVWRTRSESLFGLDADRMAGAQKEHRRIASGLRAGDPGAVATAAEDHRVRTLGAWRRAIAAMTELG